MPGGGGASGGEGGAEGGIGEAGGSDGGCSVGARTPQSTQSVPMAHEKNSDPSPPSSQSPVAWWGVWS